MLFLDQFNDKWLKVEQCKIMLKSKSDITEQGACPVGELAGL